MAAMEAAKAVMDAAVKLGQGTGDAKLRAAVAKHFLARGAGVQALQLCSEPLAAARSFTLQDAVAPAISALPSTLASLPETKAALQSIAELAQDAKAHLAADGKGADALASIESLAAALASLGHKPAEAAALSALAAARTALGGDSRDASRAAAGAVKAARASGDKATLAASLMALVRTSFAQEDPDEALRAATEVATLADELKDKSLNAKAKLSIAQAHLANEDAKQAMEASFAATALFKGLGDKLGQASAMSVAYDVNVILGQPVAASTTAQDIFNIVKGDKKAEAAAKVMQGSVNTASQDALAACKEALALYRALKDAAGEAAAHMAAATAQVSAPGASTEEALSAARDALAAFKKLGNKSGEAAALSTVAGVLTQRREASEAEKAAREALDLFREVKNSTGESYASAVLKNAKAAGIQVSAAGVTIDETSGVAQVELSDNATRASMQDVIVSLQASKNVMCVVLHLTGAPPKSMDESTPASFGMFLMGLRMVGLPVVCSITGTISGPMWSFVLTSDYRMAATSSSYVCPLWGKPEVMGALVGHNSATQLCMTIGPRDALVMLEHGVLHQLQRGKDDTRTAAIEMAKRVAKTPGLACRKKPFLLTQAVEEYAVAAATGKIAVL